MPDSKIRAVIFDMDGTLLNTLADIAHSVNSALKRHGFPAHHSDSYRMMVGAGMRVTVQRAIESGEPAVFGPPDDAMMRDRRRHVTDELITLMVSEVQTAYAADPVGKTELYDGVDTLLTALADRDIPVAILSNKPDPLVKLVAREFLSRWTFWGILGAQDGFPEKPDPTAALNLVDHLSIDPAEVLFLGDSDIDMMTARSAGMFAVGALWGFRDASELWTAGARATVEHPDEILLLLNDDRAGLSEG